MKNLTSFINFVLLILALALVIGCKDSPRFEYKEDCLVDYQREFCYENPREMSILTGLSREKTQNIFLREKKMAAISCLEKNSRDKFLRQTQ